MKSFIICILMSSLTMYFMTKLAIRLSNKISFYDFPKERNLHTTPIPILGGFALLVSILVNIFMFTQWEWSPFTAGCVGAFLIFLIGLYDDKYVLRPWLKILLQSMVITFLYYHHIHKIYMINMLVIRILY